jgi:hypothetical protein
MALAWLTAMASLSVIVNGATLATIAPKVMLRPRYYLAQQIDCTAVLYRCAICDAACSAFMIEVLFITTFTSVYTQRR